MNEDKPYRPSNPRDDWTMWMAVNPNIWLIPILISVLATALIVHAFVWDDFGFEGPVAAEEAPAE